MYRKSKQVINSENLMIDRHFNWISQSKSSDIPVDRDTQYIPVFFWYFKAVDRAEEFERLSKLLV